RNRNTPGNRNNNLGFRLALNSAGTADAGVPQTEQIAFQSLLVRWRGEISTRGRSVLVASWMRGRTLRAAVFCVKGAISAPVAVGIAKFARLAALGDAGCCGADAAPRRYGLSVAA